ncbi:MAG: hypothetical protein FGM33_00985 [Candidatus Kapabacteria bacterium]|nr:hypothetical protein [Candidatus Kapabacteria bacterium]
MQPRTRNHHLTLVLAVCLLVGSGCTSTTEFGQPVVGTPVSVKVALDPRNTGRSLTVQGTIREVCRDEGCWFTISDSSNEITVRYVAENGLGIPIIARGPARVHGVIRDTVIGRNRIPEIRADGVMLLEQ